MAFSNITLLCIVAVVLLARPAVAFGAGDIASISKIEGQNWRHGDLENVLLTLVSARAMNGGKKFSSLDVKRIYFGNWLRDYSQAVDVGTVKHVSAEAIRIVLWILGFMSFGYGSKEFEVTTERLGCYRPEEHIDNPKDYAENEDARQYDRRLRGPVNERKELAIDPETGMKVYIASENLGIMTSATLVRKLYSEAIERGRRYARSNDKADKYEAYRLLGTANHCLEDFSAHSNYVELALIEMGERDVFPHVGRNCEVRLPTVRGSRAPLITGTFGGVDFLHSVCGEFDDKATQSEIQELEGTLQNAQNQGGDQSALQDLLNSVPSGLFGGKDEAGKADELKQHAMEAQMNNTQVTPREPEEWLQYIQDVQKQIYPIIEWHDEIMQSITETIDKIPILPDVLEKVTEHVNMYVFSLMAPFVLPIIQQIKNELNAGSGAIIDSSESAQHVVFNDPDSSDPTHSMLSKDHFSNVLNEPAGKVAGEVLRWVVPMIVECWDNEDIDVDRTINRIIRGVLHHPALRQEGEDGASDGRQRMFAIVEKWWSEQSSREQDSLREQLSRDGVQEGRNHKPGVKDHGHGSCKPLGMPTPNTSGNPSAPGGIGPGSGLSSGLSSGMSQAASEAVGGGALGSLVGGLAGAVGGGIMAGITSSGNEEEQTQSYGRISYGDNGSRTQTYGQTSGRQESGNYGRSEYSRTEDRYGQSESYSSYSQNTSGGHSSSTRREEHSSYGGSESRRHENESTNSYSRQETSGYGDDGYGSQRIGSRRNDDDNEGSNYGRRQQDTSYGRGDRNGYSSNERQDDDNERLGYGQRQQESSYGRGDRDEYSSNRRDDQYRQDNDSYGSSGRYDQTDRFESQASSYGRQQESSGRSNRDEYQSGGYGRLGGDDYSSAGYRQRDNNDEYNSGSGGRRNDNEEMPGGFGGEDNESSTYGRRRGDNDEDEDEYSRRQGYGY